MISVNHNNALLSHRETEVVKLLSLGYSTRDIAKELYIGFETVKTHRKNIRMKLDAQNVCSVIIHAIQKRILLLEMN